MFLIVSRGYGGTESPQGARCQAGAVCQARPGGQGPRALGAEKTPPRPGRPPTNRARGKTAAGEGAANRSPRPHQTKDGGRGKTRPRAARERQTAAAARDQKGRGARENATRRARENRSRERGGGRPGRRAEFRRACTPGLAWQIARAHLRLLSSVVPMGLSLFVSGARKGAEDLLRSNDL